jgi:hypothetical protein
VGQYIHFAGIEREPEGNVPFAGEHTWVDFQATSTARSRPASEPPQELISA